MPDVPDLPPEQDAVRRLLADARHDAPTPPEVVARLDAALAGLHAERAAGPSDLPSDTPTTAPVVDLASRRRRRVGAGVLAAAAAVVAGVAIGQVLPTTSGSSDSGSSSAGGAGGADIQQRDAAGSASQDSSGMASETAPEAKSQSAAPGPAAPTVSAYDAQLGDRLVALRAGALPRSRPSTFSARDSCPLPRTGPGRRLTVEVDGQPGVVVYRPPAGEQQSVAVYVCGATGPVRTLRLPAP